MGRYINLFTDFGFKKIFGSEENKDILLDFLNTLLAGSQNLVSLTYLNTERLGKRSTERKAIFDLYCENDKGEKFIIELQRAKQEFFKERSIFYASRAIEEQAQQGTWNYDWKAIYVIAIMDFEFMGMGHQNVKSDVILYDTENQRQFSNKLRFIYLEMPKFRKNEDQLESNYDKWLYLLKNISYLEEIPARLQVLFFEKVFELAEYIKLKPASRKAYEESLKEYRDYYNTIDTARKDEKIDIAKNAIQEGASDEFIAKITGLSPEDIKKLKEENSEIS